MKYRRLGRSGLEVSVVGIGTYQFGGEWGKDFTQREVDANLGIAEHAEHHQREDHHRREDGAAQ